MYDNILVDIRIKITVMAESGGISVLRILIAEDDLTSRMFLGKFLSQYGACDMVADGLKAIDAGMTAINEGKPYDLICLDIMMPKVDGVKVLKAIREFENRKGIASDRKSKIIMTTALSEAQFVQNAFEYGCEAYASKPIDLNNMVEILERLGLIEKRQAGAQQSDISE